MNLYHLSLQRPTAIYCAVHGNFTGGRIQEIAVSKGTALELLKHDPSTGKLHSLISVEAFGIIRSLMAFRLTGGQKDYLVAGTDSGRIVILEYDPVKNKFEKVHQETFGKSGCRRIVPGQYMAMDPKGRAVMICGVEKQKFVYIFNRDAQARLTISSPLEAHKSFNVVFAITGIDVGFENPLFACIEMDYEEADDYKPNLKSPLVPRQNLTFYELDLGLNHVIRKSSSHLPHVANMLLQVPGGSDGPGGVLVCCEDYLIYRNVGSLSDIKCLIPRRRDDLQIRDRAMIIVCTATYKTKNMFFFLAQTEQGDVFKITLKTHENIVSEIVMKYFDTLPIASALCVLKTGFLFVGCEFGNHHLYQIIKLGDEDVTPEFSSSSCNPNHKSYYEIHELTNLLLVDEFENYSPIIDCQVQDLADEDSPQFYMIKGRGKTSEFCVLRHGLEVTEMAESDIKNVAIGVWTVKRSNKDPYDSYIVVSFNTSTLVFSIGETIEDIKDTGFLEDTSTLCCGILCDDALIQIHPDGIRHIRPDKGANEWKTPGKKKILKCAMNSRQIVIGLSGNEVVYFELDQHGQLNEYSERRELPSNIIGMALGPIPSGQLRSRFLAVTLGDQTVRMVSLDPNDCLQPLSMQALPALAESICIIETVLGDSDGENYISSLFLTIGLVNGVLLRTSLDSTTGDLSDTRTRYLGSQPVKLFKVKIAGNPSFLAISSRSWLGYYYQDRHHLTPLTYPSLECGSSFSSEQCPEGIVAIYKSSLRILAMEKLGTIFNKSALTLKYTPRRMVFDNSSKIAFVIESEYNSYNTKSISDLKMHAANEMRESYIMEQSPENVENHIRKFLEKEVDVPKAGPGKWASLVRMIDPINLKTFDLYEFPQDEAAHCITMAKFANRPNEVFIVVGVSSQLILTPRISKGGAFYTFWVRNIEEGAPTFELMHRTETDEVPGAIISFQGRLVAGVGNLLRIYDLGKQKLLKKCENKRVPNLIVNMTSCGQRIVVFDAQESFHFVKYKPRDNQLVIFADDVTPRWLTAGCLLDYSTMAGADKFGNIFAIRLESDVKDDIDEDPTGIKSLWDRGLLNGAPQKADMLFNIHIGATPNSLQKCALIPGGLEVIIYTTLSGSIGMLVPFTTKEDVDFFQHVELYLRQECPGLLGRDHLWHRSYYFPLKGVIDGDACELYNSLDSEKKRKVAEELDRTPQEISKRLEDIRTRYAF